MNNLKELIENVAAGNTLEVTQNKSTSHVTIDKTSTKITSDEEYAYFLIIDCDLPNVKNLGGHYTSSVTGHLGETIKNMPRIPVVFSLEKAKKISKKLFFHIMKDGTMHGKKFPIFGLMILKYKLPMKKFTMKVLKQEKNGEHETNRYNFLSGAESATEDLIAYDVDKGNDILGNHRGLINVSSMNKVKLVSAQYSDTFNFKNSESNVSSGIMYPPNVINSLQYAHTLDNFNQPDIILLKKIYDLNEEAFIFDHPEATDTIDEVMDTTDVTGMTDVSDTKLDIDNGLNTKPSVDYMDTDTEADISRVMLTRSPKSHKGGSTNHFTNTEKHLYTKLKKMALKHNVNIR